MPSRKVSVLAKAPMLGAIVLTPSGREARVTGFINERVSLIYLDDESQVVLLAKLLRPAHVPQESA